MWKKTWRNLPVLFECLVQTVWQMPVNGEQSRDARVEGLGASAPRTALEGRLRQQFKDGAMEGRKNLLGHDSSSRAIVRRRRQTGSTSDQRQLAITKHTMPRRSRMDLENAEAQSLSRIVSECSQSENQVQERGKTGVQSWVDELKDGR